MHAHPTSSLTVKQEVSVFEGSSLLSVTRILEGHKLERALITEQAFKTKIQFRSNSL